MLSFDMASDFLPTITLKVRPTLQNVDHTSTLKRTITSIEAYMIAVALLVEEVIGLCRV